MDEEAQARAKARVGSVLKDKWRLDALLGVGGMAAVYAATHRNKMRVAVKMLHAELCGNEGVKTRFLREGYLANTVEHPGAVSVLDDDIAEDGSAFLVMELLEGETVEARWQRKGNKLAAPEVLVIADKLLDVLMAAHAKGIVHRDIKPENLFLTRAGGLKVLDFGIARIFESREKTGTRAGYIMGTPAFMAPEQALARWDEVDARTDLWAVGATMLTLLSGNHVHEGLTGNEQLIRSATTPAASLATFGSFPAPLVALVDRALAFDRDARWPDARAAREALRAAYAEVRGSQNKMEGVARVSSADSSGAIPVAQPPAARSSDPRMMASNNDPAALKAELGARTAERDAENAELSRLAPVIAGVKERLTLAHRKVAEIQERITAARNEAAAADDQFKRQTGARTQGVGEARQAYRELVAEFARRAAADTMAFREEFNAAREEVVALARTSRARAHDAGVCEAALGSYDASAVKRGVGVAGAFAGMVVVLFMLPLIIHMVIGSGARPSVSPVPSASAAKAP